MRRSAIHIAFVFVSLLMFSVATAQERPLTKEVRRYVRHGNKSFLKGQHDEATVQYQKAYNADSISALVSYNLGTSMYPVDWKIMRPDPKRDSIMLRCFKNATDTTREQSPQRRAMAYHNIGVMHHINANQNSSQVKYQELRQAIDAYKQALRNNPNDDEARYNLVLCMRQLPKDGENNNNDDNNNQDNQDNQEQQQQQQQQQEEQQQEQQQQEQQQQQPNQEWIEQMLNAADQKERQTRRRLDEQQQQSRGPRQRLEKNW